MTETPLSSPSSLTTLTRGAIDLRKKRFGLIVIAAMVITSFNYLCASKYWAVDQTSRITAARENFGLGLMREKQHGGTGRSPLVFGTNDIEESVVGQVEMHFTAESDKTRAQSSPKQKALAYAWPAKPIREAICDEDEFSSLRVPSFIIPGSQKAGTSALYELLSMHPHVISSQKFEVHFFDHKLKEFRSKDPESVRDDDICEQRRAYQNHFDNPLIQNLTEIGTKIATFEKTPRYLCHSYIPALVKRIVPWTKILIILRNPVDRAHSQWKMDASRWADDPNFSSFEASVSLTINGLKKMGLSKAPTLRQFRGKHYTEDDFELPTNRTLLRRKNDPLPWGQLMTNYIARGFYAQQIVAWMDYFKYGKDLKIIQYEKLQADPPGVFRDILNFIDVDPNAWPMDDEVFKRDFRPVSVRGEKAVQKMNNTTRAYLEKFYKPYNDELADLLGEEFREIWLDLSRDL